MKQGVKLAIVGIAGYFIGYYKFILKFVKTIANEYIDSQLKNDDTDETEPLLGLFLFFTHFKEDLYYGRKI